MNNETPKLAVDCIVLVPIQKNGESTRNGIVLIERKYPPLGYALPGGFVDVGETLKQAAIREMKEELNLDVTITNQVGIYDNPSRDPRTHVISVVFLAFARNKPVAGDDAKKAFVWDYKTEKMPKFAFDHSNIIIDSLKLLES